RSTRGGGPRGAAGTARRAQRAPAHGRPGPQTSVQWRMLCGRARRIVRTSTEEPSRGGPMSRIDLAAARCEATFVALLEGRTVTVPTLPALIRSTVRRYGTRGCAEIVATEYGEHPEVAVWRMG